MLFCVLDSCPVFVSLVSYVRMVLFVSEYMPGGNLYDFLHKQNNFLELLTILKIAISISKGMDYLHRRNIIHRDLKTANLLIGYDQISKLIQYLVGVDSQCPFNYFFIICCTKSAKYTKVISNSHSTALGFQLDGTAVV
jgi:serine/threonine protein kinase